MCDKIVHITRDECKITKVSLKPVWCITAVMMPLAVCGILVLTGGHWENSVMSAADTAALVTGSVMYLGLGAGIVEEVVFRGLVMSALEKRFHKIVAIIVPSVLFGVLHVIGNELDTRSIVQLLFAGSMVGILFSLVAYESGNIWNGALIHAVWNISVSGLLHIGERADAQAMYNYVLETDSFLLTGGDFGIEASVVSVGAYALFAVLAFVLWRAARKVV
ncbi:MAG: CPBP family intramembrane metalloprotease [Roseburia sp.]|nr:CPBP family intramembrane metalloprotease [Roseburia sp.]